MITRNELPLIWLLGFVFGIALTAFLAGVARTADRHSAIAAKAGAYDAKTGEFVYGCGKEAR